MGILKQLLKEKGMHAFVFYMSQEVEVPATQILEFE